MFQPKRSYGADFRKIVLILVLAVTFNVTIYAQSKKVTIEGKNLTIENVFSEIESQTGFSFAYSSSQLDMQRRVSLFATGSGLKDVLNKVLKGTGYSYHIKRNRIFIARQKEPARTADIIAAGAAPAVETLPQSDTIPALPEKEFRKLDMDETGLLTTVKPISKTFDSSSLPALSGSNATPVYSSPRLALKSNLLFGAILSPGIGAEVRLGEKYTLDVAFSINPWNQNSTKKFNHLLIQPEFRYWFCDPFAGHFVGIHAAYSNFNISGTGFSDYMKDHRFEGNFYGGGISYGYQWYLSPRWSLEATIGAGYLYIDYDRYECKECGKKQESAGKNYFGPTKAGISIIYMIK